MTPTSLTLGVDRLVRGRIRQVQELLKPLVRARWPVPCCFVKNAAVKGRIISGHAGGSAHSDHRSLWFPTFTSNVQGEYFEIWYPTDGEEQWMLERAYFTLRRVARPMATYQEILCVHCDPLATDGEPVRTYKRGPHLHVVVAETPVPDAHFPLNLGHLNEVLASIQSLTAAMRTAIEVVCNEVVSRM